MFKCTINIWIEWYFNWIWHQFVILSKYIYIYTFTFDYFYMYPFAFNLLKINSKFSKKKIFVPIKILYVLSESQEIFYHCLFFIYLLLPYKVIISRHEIILHENFQYCCIENNQIIDKTSISLNHKVWYIYLISIISCENNQMLNDGTQNS